MPSASSSSEWCWWQWWNWWIWWINYSKGQLQTLSSVSQVITRPHSSVHRGSTYVHCQHSSMIFTACHWVTLLCHGEVEESELFCHKTMCMVEQAYSREQLLSSLEQTAIVAMITSASANADAWNRPYAYWQRGRSALISWVAILWHL